MTDIIFENNLDLRENELKAVVLEKLGTNPAQRAVARVYFRTDLGYPVFDDGSSVKGFGENGPIDLSNAYSILPATSFPALSGDVSNAAGQTSVTVTQVAGRTAATIADATDKRHTQGTDTGTTSDTFQLDSDAGGPKLKHVSGELQVRDAGDSAFARLRVGDLVVEGTQTILNSNTVAIGDSMVELNSDVSQQSENANGGIAVRRLKAGVTGTGTLESAGTTVTGTATQFTSQAQVGDELIVGGQRRRIGAITSDTSLTVEGAFAPDIAAGATYQVAALANAEIYFDISTNTWQLKWGDVAQALRTHQAARKYATFIGDGTNKTFTVTHALNTQDCVVQVRRVSDDALVNPGISWPTADTVQIIFGAGQPPATNSYRVSVVG